MIGLQAVCFALGESFAIPVSERLLGIDRAGVIIRNHARELDKAWGSEPMPEQLLELMADARSARDASAHIGFVAVVESDGFVMPAIDEPCARAIDDGFTGELFAAPPGTILAAGEPALFSRPHPLPFEVPGLCAHDEPIVQEQIYRSTDESANLVRDEIVAFHKEMPAGRPLLEPMVPGGASGTLVREPRTDAQVRAWIEEQARTFDGREHVVLRHEPDDDSEATEPTA